MQVLYVCTNFVYTYTCASIHHLYASLYINCLDINISEKKNTKWRYFLCIYNKKSDNKEMIDGLSCVLRRIDNISAI